jgi:hypothetical protein
MLNRLKMLAAESPRSPRFTAVFEPDTAGAHNAVRRVLQVGHAPAVLAGTEGNNKKAAGGMT